MAGILDTSNNNIIKDKLLEENQIIFKKYIPIEKKLTKGLSELYTLHTV